MPRLKRKTGLFIAIALLLMPSLASDSDAKELKIALEPEQAFNAIVTAWKEERFGELYNQGCQECKKLISKHEFVRLMENSNAKLQCCWTTVQKIKEVGVSPAGVYLAAILGYKIFSRVVDSSPAFSGKRLITASTYKEDTFLLHREQGFWKIDLSDVLAAGGYIFTYPPFINKGISSTHP